MIRWLSKGSIDDGVEIPASPAIRPKRSRLNRLSSFRRPSGDRSSAGASFSFQDLLKNNVLGKPSSSDGATVTDARKGLSFDSIRESLKKKGNREIENFPGSHQIEDAVALKWHHRSTKL